MSTVEQLVTSSKNKPAGVDNRDVRLLKHVADVLALPICHIINLTLEKSICPGDWKIAKIIPLPKNNKETFSGKNSRSINILPTLSKIMERTVDNIQCCFADSLHLADDNLHLLQQKYRLTDLKLIIK